SMPAQCRRSTRQATCRGLGPPPSFHPREKAMVWPQDTIRSTTVVLTNGVSRLQTNESNSTCRSSCHGHTLPPRWSKAYNTPSSGGVYDHHHRVYHSLILSGG